MGGINLVSMAWVLFLLLVIPLFFFPGYAVFFPASVGLVGRLVGLGTCLLLLYDNNELRVMSIKLGGPSRLFSVLAVVMVMVKRGR